jgi:hypothetical protein
MTSLISNKNKKLVLTKVVAVLIVFILMYLGIHYLTTTHAQTPATMVETEAGSIAAPATIQSDPNASGGKYVNFAAPATPPSTTYAAKSIGAYSGWHNFAGDKAIGALIGHPLTFASEYLDYRDPTNGWSSTGQGITNASYIQQVQALQATNGTNFRMAWGIPMLPTVSLDPVTHTTTNCITTPATCWAQGSSGDYNQYYKTVAQSLVQYGQANAVIRLGWEFNSKNFQVANPWFAPGYSTQFVQYWQNVVTTMRSVSPNFVFDWNPNIGSNTIPNLPSYYPGDSYVDVVGLDVYDVAWQTYPGPQANWNTIANGPQGLNWLTSFAAQHNKQITLPEWGLGFTQPTMPNSGMVSGGDNPYFVQQIANYINTNKVFEAGVWNVGPWPLPNATNDRYATSEFVKDFK